MCEVVGGYFLLVGSLDFFSSPSDEISFIFGFFVAQMLEENFMNEIR